jgi:hypothetical protein
MVLSVRGLLYGLVLASFVSMQCAAFAVPPSGRVLIKAEPAPSMLRARGPRPCSPRRTRSELGGKEFSSLQMSTPNNEPTDTEIKKADDGQKKNPLQRLLAWRPKKVTTEQLAAMGVATLLAYGAVSNVNMAVCVMISWVTFGKATGKSPLDPGQWPGFVAIYAGIWVANNFLRPARIALAVAIGPYFERLVTFWQRKFKISQQLAFGFTVFLVNICGTFSLLFGGLLLVTTATGTPLLKTVQDPPALVTKR